MRMGYSGLAIKLQKLAGCIPLAKFGQQVFSIQVDLSRLSGSKLGIQGLFLGPVFLFCLNPIFAQNLSLKVMYWTLELASYLDDAPWPASKDELVDYAIRSGAPLELIENLQELEDDGDAFETIHEIWPDYPTTDEYFYNEDEL